MTTTIPAATAEHILAVDLGNYESVLCAYHAGCTEVAESTIDTTRRVLQNSAPRPTSNWDSALDVQSGIRVSASCHLSHVWDQSFDEIFTPLTVPDSCAWNPAQAATLL